MKRCPATHTLILLCIALTFLTGCSKNESSFAQLPGFKAYFDENTPSTSLPSPSDQALLAKFKPRVFLAKGQTPFIDFYADYIANGALYVDDTLISDQVTQSLLNEYRDNHRAEFRFSKIKQNTSPVIYARIHRSDLSYQQKKLPLTFLSYNLVFAHSGLLKGLPRWQKMLISILGDHTDWHQLDHYVGLTLALHEQKPIALMLQHHNYQTTLLINDSDIDNLNNNNNFISNDDKNDNNTIRLADGQGLSVERIAVDVAMQSNELYLHTKALTKHPGLSWVQDNSIEFLKTGKNKPLMAGWDITHGEVEQDYTLQFLPPADAFYTFKGKLGESRKLPGRDGPPGADYVTLPALIPLPNRIVSAYRPRTVNTEQTKIKALFDTDAFLVKPKGLNAYKKDFVDDVSALHSLTWK